MEKKRIRQYAAAGLLAAAAAAVGITGAVVLHDMTLDNPIKTPGVTVTIREDLNRNEKKARFVNDGEADVFLRVGCAETWVYTDPVTGEREILPNLAREDAGDPASTVRVAEFTVDGNYWEHDEETGWYYYKRILPSGLRSPGKNETELFVDAVTFRCLEAAQDGSGGYAAKPGFENADKYAAADYQLHFTVEAVQASDEADVSADAVRELFGKTIVLTARGGDPGEEIGTVTRDGRTVWNWPDGTDKYSAAVRWSDSGE